MPIDYGPCLLAGGLAVLLPGCLRGTPAAASIERLRAADSAQRIHAVKSLAKRPKEAEVIVPALAAALKDENAFVRRDAAEALGRFGPRAKASSPALVAALKDKNLQVRKAAIAALQRVDPEAAKFAKLR